MYLRRLKLINFRNCREGTAEFSHGVTIIAGGNGAGKTSLLEAAQYSLCGYSFRASREQEMISSGAPFLRLETATEWGNAVLSRSVGLEAGAPARVDAGGGPKWLPAGAVLCFSPDDLMLVKGAPALRRRFLDDAVTRRLPAYQRLVTDYQKVLSQRNVFLQRARAGLVPLADITPWDRQLASLALQIYEARGAHCRELLPWFADAWRGIAGRPAGVDIAYRSQLDGVFEAAEPEKELLCRLRDSWSSDLERLSSGTGTHRDDVEFLLEGRSIRRFGSQGEQRTTVLALLLGERGLACENGSRPPLLLLDDVMSELDRERRRRLMAMLTGAGGPGDGFDEHGLSRPGQTIITAADVDLFSTAEREEAAIFHIEEGLVTALGEGVSRRAGVHG